MDNKLAINLKKTLALKKMTAKELATLSGLSVSRISDMLNLRAPSLKNLIIVADCLGVSIDFLLRGTQEKNGEENHIQVTAKEFQKVYELDELFKVTISISKDNKGKK